MTYDHHLKHEKDKTLDSPSAYWRPPCSSSILKIQRPKTQKNIVIATANVGIVSSARSRDP
jgi:hypothetical protein